MPVLARQRALVVGDRRVRIQGQVAREDASTEEIRGVPVDRELEVSVQKPVGDPLLEGGDQLLDADDLDDALELLPRRQPQRD